MRFIGFGFQLILISAVVAGCHVERAENLSDQPNAPEFQGLTVPDSEDSSEKKSPANTVQVDVGPQVAAGSTNNIPPTNDDPQMQFVEESPVPGDLNGDGVVTSEDLAIFLGLWGSSDPRGDLNGDGLVNVQDLAILLSYFSSSEESPSDPSPENPNNGDENPGELGMPRYSASLEPCAGFEAVGIYPVGEGSYPSFESQGICPHSASKVIYVSNDGSDAQDGLSPQTALSSVQAGIDKLRDGKGDWLVLARGQEFLPGDTLSFPPNGMSAEKPTVMTSYSEGFETNRPVLKWGSEMLRLTQCSGQPCHVQKNGMYTNRNELRDVAVVGIGFRSETGSEWTHRSQNNQLLAGDRKREFFQTAIFVNMYSSSSGGTPGKGILFEDNHFYGFGDSLVLQTATPPNEPGAKRTRDVVITGNTIVSNYLDEWNNLGFLLVAMENLVVAYNVFLGFPDDGKSHQIYHSSSPIKFSEDAMPHLYYGNVFYNPPLNGPMFRDGGDIVCNLLIDSAHMPYGSGTVNPHPDRSRISHNVSINPGKHFDGAGIQLTGTLDTVVSENITLGGRTAFSFMVTYGNNEGYPGAAEIHSNHIYGSERAFQFVNANFSQLKIHNNFSNADFHQRMLWTFDMSTPGFDFQFFDNHYQLNHSNELRFVYRTPGAQGENWLAQPFSSLNFTQWKEGFTRTENSGQNSQVFEAPALEPTAQMFDPSEYYPEPSRSLESFASSFGFDSHAAYMELLATRSRLSPLPGFGGTAVINYIQEGFGLEKSCLTSN